MVSSVVVDFPKNFVNALNNPQLRRNLRAAMDTLGMRRRAIFSDKDAFEALRAQGDAIRQRSLRQLPQLLNNWKRNAPKTGFRCIGPKPRRKPAGFAWALFRVITPPA